MSEIKVGQIREYFDDILITTHIESTKDRGYIVDCIYKDGIVNEITYSYLEDSKLIAEYPTWQEAVNSPEFKGDM